MRQSPRQIGTKERSNPRWIVGAKLGLRLNQWGLIAGWDCAPANVHDSCFQPLVASVPDTTVGLVDSVVHAPQGDPPTMPVCARGAWNDQMVVETVLSMRPLTAISSR